MIIALGYIAAILMGITLAIFGAGGSILTVPILVYVFSVPPLLATAYSLIIVGLVSAMGVFFYSKKKLLQWKLAAIFAPPSMLGVYLSRKFIITSIPEIMFANSAFSISREKFIMGLFAILMISSAISMLLPEKKPQNLSSNKTHNFYIIAIEGLAVGVLTGLVGAGGGFLVIPALVFFAKIPLKEAVGTSLVIISAKSLFGFLGDYDRFSQMNFTFLLSFAGAAIIGMLAGTFLADKVSGQKLKPAFGIFIIIIGIIVLWNN